MEVTRELPAVSTELALALSDVSDFQVSAAELKRAVAAQLGVVRAFLVSFELASAGSVVVRLTVATDEPIDLLIDHAHHSHLYDNRGNTAPLAFPELFRTKRPWGDQVPFAELAPRAWEGVFS